MKDLLHEHWQAAVVGVGGLLVAAAYLSYDSCMLPGAYLGMAMALAVACAAAFLALRTLLPNTRTRSEVALCFAAAGVAFALSIGPALTTLLPAAPIARGRLSKSGDAMALNADAEGRVRVVVHGTLLGTKPAQARYTIAGTEEPVTGRISRVRVTRRAGKRGRTKELKDRNWVVGAATVPPGAGELRLESLDGPLTGALEIEVFRDYWPIWAGIAVGLLAVVGTAVLAAGLEAGAGAAAAVGFGAAFGVAVHEMGTPATAIDAEVSAAIVAGLVGTSVGVWTSWIAKYVGRSIAARRARRT